MSRKLVISVTISPGLSRFFGDALSGVIEIARIAEDVGLDQVVVADHLGMTDRLDRYPYGEFPYPLEEPWLEPLTTLAAIAGATKRIRLGTGILIAPLRPALLLAKTLATLDVLSHGRVDLGIGTGWQPEEFDAAGVPFEGRAARMDDTLRACRVLWRDAPASFKSETVSFDDMWCLPRPIQPGGIPIWFGLGLSQRNIERMIEFGAGWLPMISRVPELTEGIRQLRGALSAAGRDPETFGVRVSVPAYKRQNGSAGLEKALEAVPALREAGATVASFSLARFARRPEDIRPFLERIAQIRA